MLIENYCRSANEPFEIYVTKKQYDAIDFLKTYLASHSDVRVFACGGDGTLYDVVNGCIGFENVSVGVMPLGSGNDFVRNFKNKENFLNFEKQLSGTPITLDLIRCVDRYAISQCSMGLDAETCALQAKYKRLPAVSGEFAFVLAAVYCLLFKKSNLYTLTVDGKKQEQKRLLFCLTANTRFYGGGYLGAPDALCRDGFIDLVTVEDPESKFKLLSMLGKYKKGLHKSWEITQITRCKKVEIEAQQTAAVNVDGECHSSKRAVFEIAPLSIRFIVPDGCELNA